MKKVCYTVITGEIDSLKEPLKHSPGWDMVCFTTDRNIQSKSWDLQLIDDREEPKKLSRYFKILNHFPDYHISVYCDATFTIKNNLDYFALNKSNGIWLNKHPQRQCLYEEAGIVKGKGLDDADTVDAQILKYKAEGYPEQNGLYRCGIMVRNPRDSKITELCDIWWREVEQGSWRDQISFSYTAWRVGVTPNTILHGITSNYFKQSLHKAVPTDEWIYDNGEAVEKENPLIKKYDTAHLILLPNRFLIPKWLKNYISFKVGRERFIELTKILGGIVVHG